MLTGGRLFAKLNSEIEETADGGLAVVSKGRSQQAIQKRNEHLMARLYYYNNFTDLRSEKVFELMADEFYLEVSTLLKVISDNFHLGARLKNERPPLSYFQKQWPWFRWS